jgi:hypothetical protein
VCAWLDIRVRRWRASRGSWPAGRCCWTGRPPLGPKSASGIVSDLDENAVREYALGHGRVDVKVCAIDGVWSGLKHVIRKADR